MGEAFPAYERPCCWRFSGQSVLHTPRGQPCARASCYEAGPFMMAGHVAGYGLLSSLKKRNVTLSRWIQSVGFQNILRPQSSLKWKEFYDSESHF